MSSERYELAQDELEALLERVEATMELITDQKKKVNSEEHRYWMTRTRSELNDARGFIQEMEQEAREAPAQYRYLFVNLCKTEGLFNVIRVLGHFLFKKS